MKVDIATADASNEENDTLDDGSFHFIRDVPMIPGRQTQHLAPEAQRL